MKSCMVNLMMVLMICTQFEFGCEGGKGPESEMPDEGLTDSFRSPTTHGKLQFGGENSAEFDGVHFYHAWTFTLIDSAKISVAVSEVEDDFDSVMYLYRRDKTSDRWGHYRSRNDDYQGHQWSRLDRSLSPGLYRILVKGYEKSLRGNFSLGASCTGLGCPAESVDYQVRAILRENGIWYLSLSFPPDELAAQSAELDNQVSFEAALQAAIISFLTDGQAPESPLELIKGVGPYPPCEQNEVIDRLYCYLNRPRTLLALVPRVWESEEDPAYPPEYGESITENWVFMLYLTEFSDHLHWAIVNRTLDASGKIQVYNYGFN